MLFLLLIGMGSVSAKEIKSETTAVDVPALSKRVTDIAKVLTKEENQRLTRQIKKLQSEKEVQIAVLIIPTTGSNTVEEFASRVFDSSGRSSGGGASGDW
ncbi:TPM domain-containing protein [Xenorhabdus littoralis]|nr:MULTISPECIES: TPM domain-containing protein [unclassified Xenorhabdus]